MYIFCQCTSALYTAHYFIAYSNKPCDEEVAGPSLTH